jgi:transcriptional regulator with XRE-family HTH domain
MTKPFSLAFKNKMLQRMTGRDAVSARRLASESGVTQTTLSRWLSEAHSLPEMPPKKKPAKGWSVGDKIRILGAARNLTGEELDELLKREGVLRAELEQWRLALEEEGRSSKATTKRIRSLERELARKEKALAEAAALLVLKKKVAHLLWEDEDDDTDEGNEK